MSNIQCINLDADRKLGQEWEREFVKMAARYGKCFTAHQWHKEGAAIAYYYRNGWNQYTLPDITIWTAPGEHHEIKHKNKTKAGSYGLEDYRFAALLSFSNETRQPVYYTIHDHDLSGGKFVKENRIEDWVSCEIHNMLEHDFESEGQTWRNSAPSVTTIYYWSAERFVPLYELWVKP